jgi:hypothetical protein
MKFRIVRFAALLGIFSVGGCVSKPENPVIGADRQLAFTTPGEATAPLTVRRLLTYYGSGCSVTVKVNDTAAARMNVGEEVTLHVPEGGAVIRSEMNPWCDPLGQTTITGHIRLVRGTPATYAFGYDMRMERIPLR